MCIRDRSWFEPGLTHTTKRGREATLVEESLDLDVPATDAMRFIPVKLRLADVAVFDEANERDALVFTPTCFSISFLQVTKDPDSLVNRNGFDLGEFADDLEVHARKILSRPLLPQTLLLEATNPLRAPGIAVGLRFIITRSAVPT